MSVHGITEALPKLAQQHCAFALLDALLDTLPDRLLAPGLDDVLGLHEELLVVVRSLCRVSGDLGVLWKTPACSVRR
ncbi:MAG TPA: hypothetical protein VK932_04265 [Kofleriaceae bacterium]|nr:hypothetical protein [Kofleriaceae bacterium]